MSLTELNNAHQLTIQNIKEIEETLLPHLGGSWPI